jgi:phosphopantetheinyl transferase
MPSSTDPTGRTSRGSCSSAIARSRWRRARCSGSRSRPRPASTPRRGDSPPVAAAGRRSPRTQIQFNVANTAGLVGCAIALDRELGLDLEAHRADAPPELVARCFTPAERAGLAARPAADQPRRFVELWVCKEAYLKARGVGLGLPLEHIDVVLDDGDPHLRLDPALGDDAATWQLALWSPTPAHAAALCVRRPAGAPPVTTRHHWDP